MCVGTGEPARGPAQQIRLLAPLATRAYTPSTAATAVTAIAMLLVCHCDAAWVELAGVRFLVSWRF